MSILTTQIMKKHWNKFRLSKKCIAFLMNNASVFSGEMTMIANSYLTYSFSRSVTPRTLRAGLCRLFFWQYSFSRHL